MIVILIGGRIFAIGSLRAFLVLEFRLASKFPIVIFTIRVNDLVVVRPEKKHETHHHQYNGADQQCTPAKNVVFCTHNNVRYL